MAFLAVLLSAGLTLPLLGRGFEPLLLALWLSLLVVLLLARYLTAREAEKQLDGPPVTLRRYDRRFRILSLCSQVLMGAGIWMAPSSSAEIAPYVMTMLIAIYGVGTMINLTHDFESVRITMPFLMGQPVLFWFGEGLSGAFISAILVALTWLMISSSRNAMQAFVDSIAIRFEKDDLLERLEDEKQATQEALAAAEEANRAKSFFMAAASHDLRQPLYAATLLSDTLALHELPSGAGDVVAKQREALGAATALFDNLLDLSKFESGVIQPTFQCVPLSPLFAQMQSEFHAMAAAKGVRLEVDSDPPAVRSDFDLLTRMLRNLLSNAVRYTHQGAIRLGWRIDGDGVRVTVVDTGVGIPEQHQERVFRAFQQLDNPQRSRDKGVGLGLAIVRHISELLDHPIELESVPGRGTKFEFRARREQMVEATAPAARTSDSIGTVLAGCTAWVVEDDPLVSEALAQYLALQGCRHHRAIDRQDLQDLEERYGLPDFVILDDMLGGVESGLELAQWLARRLPRERILLTTGNSALERWELLDRSGLRVLRKPVSTNLLAQWLREVLESAPEGKPGGTAAAD